MFGVYDSFSFNCAQHPDKTAVVMGEQRYTYSLLSAWVNSLACSLDALGCRRGDRVGFMFRNSPEFIAVFYALQKLGAVAVPFSFLCTREELEQQIKEVECRVFLYEERYAPLVREVKPRVSSVAFYIHTGVPAGEGEYSFSAMLSGENSAWDYNAPREARDHALYLFTSGSTGKPKCVVHTNESLALFVVLPIISNCAFSGDDIILYYAPLFHLAGISYLLYMMTLGGSLVLMERFSADQFLFLVEREKVTQTFIIPPSLISRLESSPLSGSADLSSVNCVIMSGGVNAPQYGEKIFRMFPRTTVCNTYGQSERAANTILFLTREQFAREPELINSVGKVTQFSQIKLLDDGGNEADCGEAYARCPGMFTQYLRKESPFVDGWFPTGDVLQRDENGYCFFRDRKKDMIKTGGENVFSAEVEGIIKAHPAVANCAVVGLPDPEFGEAVSAAVVINPGMELSEEELIRFCRERMAPFKKPRNVFFLEKLPVSAAGKVQKALLREELKKLL